MDILSRFAKKSPLDQYWDDVMAFLTPSEHKLARVFAATIQRAKDGFDTDEIIRLISVGDYDRAATLALGEQNAGDVSLFLSMRIAMEEAAIDAVRRIPEASFGPTPKVQIDALNEPVITAIRTETMDAVTQVNRATKEALRLVQEHGVRQGDHPRVIAQDMRDMLGLTDRDAQAVLNYRDELERGSKAALRRGLRNKRYDKMILRGDHEKRIDKLVDDYRDRLIKHRAETVSITEAARAFNIGQHQVWTQAALNHGIDRNFIRRYWVVTRDERTCDVCNEIADAHKKGVGLDEPFDTPSGPLLLPPDHPRCRCTIRYSFDLTGAVRALARGQ